MLSSGFPKRIDMRANGWNSAVPSEPLRHETTVLPHINKHVAGTVLGTVFCAVLVFWSGNAAFGASAEEEANDVVVPSLVTVYDVATARELFYYRHTAPFIVGASVGEWPLWDGLKDAVGPWVTTVVEANRIASTIADSFPVGEQEAARKVNDVVDDCAQVLGLKKPHVFIRRSPHVRAYVTEVDGQAMLTLTSGLLALYDSPQELRFVVGRELGRVKCGHVEERAKAYAVFAALHSVNLTTVPDEFQNVLPTLALGWLMSFYREMEFSADRAGLLCCQDLDTAYQAMLRDLHGLPIDSPWLEDVKFDPQKYLKTMEYWERKPLVAFIQNARQHSSSTPFIRERIAELTVWAQRGSYGSILARVEGMGPDLDQLVTIRSIEIRNVADQDADVNPYLVVYSDGKKLFETSYAKGKKSVRWTGIDQTRAILDNQPIFFEIWNSCWGRDALIGGFVVYPTNPLPGRHGQQVIRSALEWDWKKRTTTSRHGLGEVVLEFSSRAK